MNILVTGGLGVNGSWVTRQLLELGHEPIVFENRCDMSLVNNIADRLKVVIGDILDMEKIIYTLKKYKIKRIIHLAALMPGFASSNPLIGFKVNALGTVNVLEAARIGNIERVVFTSSKGILSAAAGEYGYPTYKAIDEDYPTAPQGALLVYGSSKIVGESMGQHYANIYGFEFLALRFSTIYGIGKSERHGSIAIHSKMIENGILGAHTKINYGGDEKDDMIYVKDCANAIVLACFAKKPEHCVYNISNGRAYSLHELANSINKVNPKASFDIGSGLDYMNIPGTYCVLDYSRAKEELDYVPKYGLDEGVMDYIKMIDKLHIKPVFRK